MLNDLSEDLIVEIFSRVQIKTLLRLRSVSKSLCACISSARFIRLHTLRAPEKLMIGHLIQYAKRIYTLHPKDGQSNAKITPIKYPFKTFNTVGSCNGILCVYEFGNDIFLWNPSLRRKITVHDLPSRSLCSRVIGFGHDLIANDYKILRTSKVGTFVYTMKTHSWREIAPPKTPFPSGKLYACLFNNMLHWVGKRYLIHNVCDYYVITFDLSSELFSTIELPEPSWKTTIVTVIEGCLAVICTEGDGHTCIWLRKQYGNTSSWFIAYEYTTNPFKGVKKVFQHGTNGDLLLHHYSKGTLVYNPDKCVERILHNHRYCSIADMDMCVESLELLDTGASCDDGTKL